MKIQKNAGLIVADKVIAGLRKELKNQKGEIHVTAYHNGRENGYMLSLWNWKTAYTQDRRKGVIVCECRGSDNIIVYVKEKTKEGFFVDDNSLTDKEYKTRNYFDWKDYDKTVKFIAKYFTSTK